MIFETIVTTQNKAGVTHIAPMGIHVEGDSIIILPFKPSATLNNFLETNVGVINFCDDVRVFAGCLTGRRDWPLAPTKAITGQYLAGALAHTEVAIERMEDDELRPKLYCKTLHVGNHKPFKGFNRGQYSVLEAAILISRLEMLSLAKIETELDYLRIGLEKTAGDKEREAWSWLMAAFDNHKRKSNV